MGLFDIFKTADPVNDDAPDDATVGKALDLAVQDSKGQEHTLRSLVQGYGRSIIVFVRHNHCGLCIMYIQSMNEDQRLRSTVSETARAKPKDQQTVVIVVGHGSYEGIARYTHLANDSTFAMYVDSTKSIHNTLGLTRRNLEKSNELPDYFKGTSYGFQVWDSMKKQASSGHLLWKGGDIALLGGEFVFDKDLHCLYAHRMQNTTDHTPAAKLAEFVLSDEHQQA